MRRFCRISIIAIAVIFSQFFSDVIGQSNRIPLGARPSGLGDAFVGVADDGNAIYWNPAGISTLAHHELNGMTTNAFQMSIKHQFLSYVFPLTDKHAIGFGWFNEGFKDEEIDWGWNIYQLTYGRNVYQNLSVGLSLKFADYSIVYDNETLTVSWL